MDQFTSMKSSMLKNTQSGRNVKAVNTEFSRHKDRLCLLRISSVSDGPFSSCR